MKRNKDSITLSEKHGVNPTLAVCFFCGENTGEIALLGRLKGDKEAPMRMIVNYEPCEACKAKFNEGVLVVEVVPEQEADTPPITEGYSPTGRYVVLREEATSDLKKGDKRLMLQNEFEQMFGSIIK